MAEYIEWENTKYPNIPKQDRPQHGDVFICKASIGKPFDDWDYIVGVGDNEGAKPLGKFKCIEMARTFASAI